MHTSMLTTKNLFPIYHYSLGPLSPMCIPPCLRHYILSGPWSSTSPKLSEDSADKEERQEVTMSVTWLLPLTSYCPVA